jgi:hypothetical protein
LRSGLADGTINLSTDVFLLALYTDSATLDETTTAYTTTGEASGGNYVAGGEIVTASVSSALTSSGSVVFVNFSSPSWTGVITARGALIYKAGANGAVCVLDFGSNKTSANTFDVTMPANTSTSALIRIV